MNSIPSHKCQFILDKAHFTECYEASVDADYSVRAYFKALFFAVFGMLLVLFTPINPYMSWFIFTLGIVEALSVYYQKPWWVMRQLFSKAAQSEVSLNIDEDGIHMSSFYHSQDILWDDIEGMTLNSLGWVIHHKQGKHYLSHVHLSSEVQQFLKERYA